MACSGQPSPTRRPAACWAGWYMKGGGRDAATAYSPPRIPTRSARDSASLTRSLPRRCCAAAGPWSTAPGAFGGESSAQGVGWNTLNFSPVSFGQPATTFATGLVYNLSDLYSLSLSPGLLPLPGTINSPPYYQDRNAGRPARINQWNVWVQREIVYEPGVGSLLRRQPWRLAYSG